MMVYQKSMKVNSVVTEAREEEQGTPLVYYHQLPDGRMAPIEQGGLVELALSELGAILVDVSDERIPSIASGLN